MNISSPAHSSTTVLLAAALIASAGASAHAQQYQATLLNPAGYTEAFCEGAGGGRQFGFGRPGVGTNTHALLWSGTSSSFIDLNPNGYDGSFGYGAGGDQQVGVGFIFGEDRALLWTGTAASAVNLSPADTTASFAYSTDGARQVGYVRAPLTGVGPRACTWTGTADSAIIIHSFNYDDTTAFDTDNGRIVGVGTTFDGFYNAILWTSPSPDAAVSLHSPENFDETVAYAIRGTTIGGNGNGISTGGPNHAILWQNDGATFLDLHPGPNYFTSFIYAMNATHQVGLASVGDGSEEHAAVWSSSAASFVDLHALIPGGPYDGSQAKAIDDDGSVYGNARIGDTYFAVRWTPIAAPTSCSLADIAPAGGDGTVDGADFVAFINSFAIGDVAVDHAADVAGGGANGLSADGIIDGADFVAFINAFALGC